MQGRKFWRYGAAILLCGASATLAQPAKAPSLAVINAIEPGQWELREVGVTTPAKVMCVADPDMLIQLRHGGAACTRFVIDNQPQSATVNYTCTGAGNGRTTIMLDTPRQFRLQTQGIAQNAPFDVDYSARRLGDCGGAH